jgi:hypothetical protein
VDSSPFDALDIRAPSGSRTINGGRHTRGRTANHQGFRVTRRSDGSPNAGGLRFPVVEEQWHPHNPWRRGQPPRCDGAGSCRSLRSEGMGGPCDPGGACSADRLCADARRDLSRPLWAPATSRGSRTGLPSTALTGRPAGVAAPYRLLDRRPPLCAHRRAQPLRRLSHDRRRTPAGGVAGRVKLRLTISMQPR